jgi:hypothetical protein
MAQSRKKSDKGVKLKDKEKSREAHWAAPQGAMNRLDAQRRDPRSGGAKTPVQRGTRVDGDSADWLKYLQGASEPRMDRAADCPPPRETATYRAERVAVRRLF